MEQEILKVQKKLAKELHDLNSFPRRFALSIITGAGTVIGATVLIAFIIWILNLLSHWGILTPFTSKLIELLQRTGK